MSIKNYTSQIPVERSVTLIEHRLVGAGASHIAKVYEGEPRRLKAISFQITVNNISMIYKLPAKEEAVFKVLWAEVRKPRPETKKNILEQAQRTAWKIVADLVDIQISLVKLGQAEFAEIFLPYTYDPASDKTLFQKLKEVNFQFQLSEGKK